MNQTRTQEPGGVSQVIWLSGSGKLTKLGQVRTILGWKIEKAES